MECYYAGQVPGYPKAEIISKVELYLAKGAQEVWVVYEDGRITTYSHVVEIKQSAFAPDAQNL